MLWAFNNRDILVEARLGEDAENAWVVRRLAVVITIGVASSQKKQIKERDNKSFMDLPARWYGFF
jgi:hypothetical protein